MSKLNLIFFIHVQFQSFEVFTLRLYYALLNMTNYIKYYKSNRFYA